MSQALQDLAAAGVAVWLDDLSRPRIRSGDLARSVERHSRTAARTTVAALAAGGTVLLAGGVL